VSENGGLCHGDVTHGRGDRRGEGASREGLHVDYALAGDAVQVLAGVKPGDKVVTEGSFFLRAEATRVRSSG
jgi:hypothetical protein